jgi:hypothetical protein
VETPQAMNSLYVTIFKNEDPYFHVYFDMLDLRVFIDALNFEWEIPKKNFSEYIKNFNEDDRS